MSFNRHFNACLFYLLYSVIFASFKYFMAKFSVFYS